MKRLPDFIIIGAMKSATSTLHEQLARQAGIFMSTPKEPYFFSNDEVWSRGLDWYESLFDAALSAALCGESSTHYTKLPTYPSTIARMRKHLGSQTKFIYIMRQPIDRLISQYVHEWTQRVISCPIDEALDRHPELIAYSRYAMQLEPYFEAFGQASVLPVFFDRLSVEPQAELERVCQFIAYQNDPSWDQDLDEQNVSSDRVRKNPLRDAIINLPGLKSARRRLIPKSWRNRVKKIWMMKQRPQLSDANVQRLQSIFDQDLAILGRWLDLGLRCENFKQITSQAIPQWSDRSKATAA